MVELKQECIIFSTIELAITRLS